MNVVYYYGNDLLKSCCNALVNPVNCEGIMGKGLTLQFKEKYPNNFKDYVLACKNNELTIGHVHYFQEQDKLIINFPTKDRWRNNSELDYIESGLDSLIKAIRKLNIKSIAIPMLGCGLGGLDMQIVHTLIVNKFFKSFKNTDLKVCLYLPKTFEQNRKIMNRK